LNEALKRIHANKNELLLVLKRPDIPMHNNLSETDIREYVKKRKISGSTRSPTGRKCRDTFASLKKTCRKQGVSFWQYLMDRLGGGNRKVPYLPDLIRGVCREAPYISASFPILPELFEKLHRYYTTEMGAGDRAVRLSRHPYSGAALRRRGRQGIS
jgi:hypothetical protein